ncbi:geranylgeranylglycerol-phosphate geranylgeranyltransferase [Leeuwenhoekiella aequorea]|uniref:4-hydroxybenzoate polyprenyltransferase n=2 Tax=Leeuwenhoekiella TaxID=283735 RepID=A0A4Q0P8B8_9FLAO|nr:geranylgeranylglycerol-phosphate geranylgeranyltransferase [Leeuwenhoekiella aequorea]RXG22416.1 4-hydroxybenzoate polyprenyltransferase [Leeuwenhoekiella aequorea]CBL88188.1 4-hydroxybenzoate octaprenyltransferase [uncultured Leeuwenhoekiella sp.]
MILLKLIRYKNLLLIILTQVLVHYGFLKALNLPVALTSFNFFLLITATVLIAAAGYVINDLNDIDSDIINKPDKSYIPSTISEKSAFNYYLVLNISGVGIGFFLCSRIGLSNFTTLFVLISALLYVYASFIKRVIFIGNLLVSALVASSIFILVVFDLLPLLRINQDELMIPFNILRDYAVFACMLNFLREIVKDIEDARGDYAVGINSLPIVLGLERTVKVAGYIGVVYIFILVGYIYVYLQENIWLSLYLVVAQIIPLGLFCIKARYADKQKHYSYLSGLLKFIMLMGILSIGILTLTLKY